MQLWDDIEITKSVVGTIVYVDSAYKSKLYILNDNQTIEEGEING